MPEETHHTFGHDARQGLIDAHVDSFLGRLRTLGYARRTVRNKRWIAASFVRWTRRRQVAIAELNESHIAAFVKGPSRKGIARVRLELSVLRQLLAYLRAEAVVPPGPPKDVTPADEIELRYVDHLRNERGLAENSILVYAPFIHDFITERMAKTGGRSAEALDAVAVRDFLLDRASGRSSEYARLLAVSLRSFLRFLHLRGETPLDLSPAVPSVRKWGQASVPTSPSPEEVERVIAAADRSTPRGRRDHAILLLLARLGLRPGEIVGLELDDIDWRTGEIVIRGKGRRVDRLPLLSDVGEALAVYLREDRGASSSRKVFLRMLAPRLGLAGPAAVGHIVRLAMARAGFRRSGRGAAHLFRHSLATKMLRKGASIAEISEVLRHRSQNTTQIYAKVAFEDLRGVARPWPGCGGAR